MHCSDDFYNADFILEMQGCWNKNILGSDRGRQKQTCNEAYHIFSGGTAKWKFNKHKKGKNQINCFIRDIWRISLLLKFLNIEGLYSNK